MTSLWLCYTFHDLQLSLSSKCRNSKKAKCFETNIISCFRHFYHRSRVTAYFLEELKEKPLMSSHWPSQSCHCVFPGRAESDAVDVVTLTIAVLSLCISWNSWKRWRFCRHIYHRSPVTAYYLVGAERDDFVGVTFTIAVLSLRITW